MIRGALIFCGGIAVGTGYGFFLGLRLSKAMATMAEAERLRRLAETGLVQDPIVPAQSA